MGDGALEVVGRERMIALARGNVREPFERVAVGRVGGDDGAQQMRRVVEAAGAEMVLRRFELGGNRWIHRTMAFGWRALSAPMRLLGAWRRFLPQFIGSAPLSGRAARGDSRGPALS